MARCRNAESVTWAEWLGRGSHDFTLDKDKEKEKRSAILGSIPEFFRQACRDRLISVDPENRFDPTIPSCSFGEDFEKPKPGEKFGKPSPGELVKTFKISGDYFKSYQGHLQAVLNEGINVLLFAVSLPHQLLKQCSLIHFTTKGENDFLVPAIAVRMGAWSLDWIDGPQSPSTQYRDKFRQCVADGSKKSLSRDFFPTYGKYVRSHQLTFATISDVGHVSCNFPRLILCRILLILPDC